jgi:hypothetical protein
MITLRVIVEGQTEARFVAQILAPHLATREVYATASPVVTKGGRRGVREGQGGGDSYLVWKRDIVNWIKQEGSHPHVWFTTMFDVYGLARVRDFPGYAEACRSADSQTKVAKLERAVSEDIGFHRFVPYFQLHEFESLLLVDPTVLKHMFIEHAQAVDQLALEISETGCSAEQINDGEETCPSRRISRHLPRYDGQKVVAGPDATERIGLPRLRSACPHFAAWVARLEELGHK